MRSRLPLATILLAVLASAAPAQPGAGPRLTPPVAALGPVLPSAPRPAADCQDCGPPGTGAIGCCPTPRCPSWLLYVRFVGPPGVRVTFFRDPSGPREIEVPATVGFRPGYCYRLKVTGLPGHPEMVLFPTLEVRGTLALPLKQNPADHPVPISFDEDDLRRVFDGGAFLTKVLYLERPSTAVPAASRPDRAVETTVEAGRDLLQLAREQGRPMLVLRLGERQVDDLELRRLGIPGTVLLPGERSLPPPAVPPCLPWHCMPVYDPVAGGRLLDEECFHDGGDCGRPAGLDLEGHMVGLDPSDTLAEYTDACGRRRLTASNKVCICVPRFAAFRQEVFPAGFHRPIGPVDARCVSAQVQATLAVPSVQATQLEQLTALRGRLRATSAQMDVGVGKVVRVEVLDAYDVARLPGAAICRHQPGELTEAEKVRLGRCVAFARGLTEPVMLNALGQSQGPSVVGRAEGLKVVGALRAVDDVTCICQEVPQLLAKPLHLCKWADRDSAQIGDVVTFYLKFSNHGGTPITDVAVADSLTSRLEYVPGSARSDRNAVFTFQPNEAGSAALRWEINGTLPAGQSGVVSFQARIR